ncbi:MAG: hypothetical protein WKF57_07280 [Nakamurella sp.]
MSSIRTSAMVTARIPRPMRRRPRSASTAVRHIEEQMLAALSESARHRLHGDLTACTTALSHHTT